MTKNIDKVPDSFQTKPFKSQLTECILRPRPEDDVLFLIKEDGTVLTGLKGYAVVPKEEYLSLINQA